MNGHKRCLSAVLVFVTAAYGSTQAQRFLPNEAPTLTVCEAGRATVGSRIRVRGELLRNWQDSFTLTSIDICSGDHEGGLVWANKVSRSEKAKIDGAPVQDRRRNIPGAEVVLEGTVVEIERERFVTVERVILRCQTRWGGPCREFPPEWTRGR